MAEEERSQQDPGGRVVGGAGSDGLGKGWTQEKEGGQLGEREKRR